MARISDEKLNEFKAKMESLRHELEGEISLSVRSMVSENENGELPLSESMRDRLLEIRQKLSEAAKASEVLDDSIQEMIDLRKKHAQ